MIKTENIHPLFSAIIMNKLATLHELETVYSYEDALNMVEAISVNNYNEWVASEEARNNVRRKH